MNKSQVTSLKKLYDALPTNVEAVPYVEVVRRLCQLFSLASLLPVIGDIRFGFARQRRRGCNFEGTWERPGNTVTIRVNEHHQGVSAIRTVTVGESKGSTLSGDISGRSINWHARGAIKASSSTLREDDRLQDTNGDVWSRQLEEEEVPLGVVSVLLLLASELSVSWELFAPVKMGKKTPSGPVPELVKAVKMAADASTESSKKQGGMMDGFVMFINHLLHDEAIFASVHGVAMLAVLTIVLCYVVQSLVFKPANGKTIISQAKAVLRGLVLILPLVMFAIMQSEQLLKVWKSLLAEKVLDVIWIPLRVAGVICAHKPQAEGNNGTPGLFAAFQVGALFGLISCEMLTNKSGVAQALSDFKNSPDVPNIVGSPLLSFLLPLLLAVVWLSAAHLSRRSAALFVGILCCCFSQPVLLAFGFPKFVAGLGLGEMGPKDLILALSYLYTFVFMLAVLMGGTLSFVGGAALMHIFTRIHGIETLQSLVEL